MYDPVTGPNNGRWPSCGPDIQLKYSCSYVTSRPTPNMWQILAKGRLMEVLVGQIQGKRSFGI
jgi:hypothetical protein